MNADSDNPRSSAYIRVPKVFLRADSLTLTCTTPNRCTPPDCWRHPVRSTGKSTRHRKG